MQGEIWPSFGEGQNAPSSTPSEISFVAAAPKERKRGDLTYKLVAVVNAVLAFAHIFWTLLGSVTVLPAFYDVEFVLHLHQQDLNEVGMYL